MTRWAIRPVEPEDRAAILRLLTSRWGGETMVVRDTEFRLEELPAFVATRGDSIVGLATYLERGSAWEVLSLDSLAEGEGIGSALLTHVENAARRDGGERVSLVTTNDNLAALRFYERRGYAVVNVDLGAVDRARRVKPSIPAFAENGLPIRDEVWLEKRLTDAGETETRETIDYDNA